MFAPVLRSRSPDRQSQSRECQAGAGQTAKNHIAPEAVAIFVCQGRICDLVNAIRGEPFEFDAFQLCTQFILKQSHALERSLLRVNENGGAVQADNRLRLYRETIVGFRQLLLKERTLFIEQQCRLRRFASHR